MMAILAIIDLSKYEVFSHDQALSGKETIENIQVDDWVLLVLLSAIALTSTVWTSFQFVLQMDLNQLVAIAFGPVLPKPLAVFSHSAGAGGATQLFPSQVPQFYYYFIHQITSL